MRFITIYFSLLFIGFTLNLNAQDSSVVTLETVSTSASIVVVSELRYISV